MLAGPRGAQGQFRLHAGRQGHRDGVHVRDQFVDPRVRRHPVHLGQRRGLGRVAAPDPDEFGGRVGGQGRRVRLLRPRSRAEESEPHALPPLRSFAEN
jgi:hypothetical protein